jgi:Holliday junction DNA helicase RuvA
MISTLFGHATDLRDGVLVLLVPPGVAFEIFVPSSFKAKTDSAKEVFTHLHVQEDALRLYGFADEAGRDMFRRLITVTGVGPKTALACLSEYSAGELAAAIAGKRADLLTKAKGIGKKTAELLCVELYDKLETFLTSEMPAKHLEQKAALEGALLRLGFKAFEVDRVCGEVMRAGPQPIADMVKAALRSLAEGMGKR